MLDPRAMYGRPWVELTPDERLMMLAWAEIRAREQAHEMEAAKRG